MSAAEGRLPERLARRLGAAMPPALRAAMAAGGFLDATGAAPEDGSLPPLPAAPEHDLEAMLALTRLAAAHAAPLPLAETMLGHYALARAGLAPPLGPMTIGPVLPPGGVVRFAAGALRGRLHRLPWARQAVAAAVVVAEGDQARTILAGRPAVLECGLNLAGEPRDLVLLDDTPVLAAGAPGRGLTPAGLYRLGALFRAAAMAGALTQAADLTLRHVRRRREDGRRPLARAAVAEDMLRLAAEAAAARAVTAAAGQAAAGGAASLEEAGFAIACAKQRASAAAGAGAALAHRLQGVAALAPDHPLPALTRRLWAWRDEFGGEAEWAAWIGARARAAGGAGLWPLVADRGRMRAATEEAPNE